jgi:hypothetical protein
MSYTNNSTVKDSVTVSVDGMVAFCRNGCEIKYARKLINDYLKANTPYKGAWTVWYDHDDGTDYHFKLSNPYLEMHNIYFPNTTEHGKRDE